MSDADPDGSRRTHVFAHPAVLAAICTGFFGVGAAAMQFGPDFGCRVFEWRCQNQLKPDAPPRSFPVSQFLEVNISSFDNEYLVLLNGNEVDRKRIQNSATGNRKPLFEQLRNGTNFVTIIAVNWHGGGKIVGSVSADNIIIDEFDLRSASLGVMYIKNYLIFREKGGS